MYLSMRDSNRPARDCPETMRLLVVVRKYRRSGPFDKKDPMLERFKSSEALHLTRKMTEKMSEQETERRWMRFLETKLVRGEVAGLLKKLSLRPNERTLAENVITAAVMRRPDVVPELGSDNGRCLRDAISEEIANHFEWKTATV